MKKLKVTILLTPGFFFLWLVSYGAMFGKSKTTDYHSGVKSIDDKIVEAFNASPSRTQDVYYYCNELINKSKSGSPTNNQEWVSKAKKLITLSCFNEANNLIYNGEMKDAYMWAERGLAKGASRGRISGYNIGEYYSLLEEVKALLEAQMAKDGISYTKNQLRVDVNNTSTVKTTSERFNWQSNKRKRMQEQKTYTYLKGPLNDNFNNVYVIVKTPIKGNVRIQLYPNQGWGIPTQGNNQPQKFYKSWQQCAVDL